MAGIEERTIEVARLQFCFRGDAEAARLIEQRYGAFLCARRDRPAAEIGVEIARAGTDPSAWVNGDVEVDESGNAITLGGDGMRAEIDRRGEHATIAANGPGPIDVVLRFLLASHLSSRGGLLVHASAVERDRGAWVFPGPSGAGKTTVATHLDGTRVCDEAVALIARQDGVSVYSTPYWRARPHCARVAGLAFLRRGSEPAWRPLSCARAAARLFASSGPLLPRARAKALAISAAIANAVPAAEVTLSSVDDIVRWLPQYL